ncbi:stage II sporulation protein P [Salsuginibacillus halophilus]|uniref:Stage II sporulation protein P n=1 Tax=Salsuginibacillus halophilus TaxID=517424 RepID=A0A2P8HFR1_9BACI|nr:stage II sporulation protein P [Salsuginibacillus halophilus]PSL45040.1 stage II sporulation protein P [Salsuginibacillus halophilus]
MEKQRSWQGVTVHYSVVKQWLFTAGCSCFFIFLLIAVLTSFDHNRHLSSSLLHEWTNEMQVDMLASWYGLENRYMQEEMPEVALPSPAHSMFQLVTTVNVNDPRTFLGNEIPGFVLYDGRIAVAGEGTDITNMTVESAPPMEELMKEREAVADEQESEGEEEKEVTSPSEDPIAHIIHSHSRESFFPELEEGANVAFHAEQNITLVGERLGQRLEELGIGSEVDKADIEQKLQDRGLDFADSYDVSRPLVEEAKEESDTLEMFFDVHRDSQPRDVTTVTINGEVYARTFFVIGENHADYEKNLAMAEELHHILEDTHPGLSRGVIVKGGRGSNGRYNQDLSPQSVLIEIGGVENTLEEAYRSADVMAEAIHTYYKEDD